MNFWGFTSTPLKKGSRPRNSLILGLVNGFGRLDRIPSFDSYVALAVVWLAQRLSQMGLLCCEDASLSSLKSRSGAPYKLSLLDVLGVLTRSHGSDCECTCIVETHKAHCELWKFPLVVVADILLLLHDQHTLG